eukprot:gb/GECG01016065.1/.p1 GENE.gb/GECG01016065.1/~~gb/GECG01016065.1/.p1  ORF type:complete len:121 (+),score=3.01 gb/GECG01016065.1/:1-363(+)
MSRSTASINRIGGTASLHGSPALMTTSSVGMLRKLRCMDIQVVTDRFEHPRSLAAGTGCRYRARVVRRIKRGLIIIITDGNSNPIEFSQVPCFGATMNSPISGNIHALQSSVACRLDCFW